MTINRWIAAAMVALLPGWFGTEAYDATNPLPDIGGVVEPPKPLPPITPSMSPSLLGSNHRLLAYGCPRPIDELSDDALRCRRLRFARTTQGMAWRGIERL
jgi:hypothetical protein